MARNNSPFYLSPITESEAHDYFIATGPGPAFGHMQFWDRPPTPFQHIEGSVEADPEHIDAVLQTHYARHYDHARRYVPLAPAPPGDYNSVFPKLH